MGPPLNLIALLKVILNSNFLSFFTFSLKKWGK